MSGESPTILGGVADSAVRLFSGQAIVALLTSLEAGTRKTAGKADTPPRLLHLRERISSLLANGSREERRKITIEFNR
jgi:hypothetical protein